MIKKICGKMKLKMQNINTYRRLYVVRPMSNRTNRPKIGLKRQFYFSDRYFLRVNCRLLHTEIK